MSNVPEEFHDVLYIRGGGQDEAKAAFIIQFPHDAEETRFAEMGRDENGIYLATDDGDKSRITGDGILDAFDETDDCDTVHLFVLDSSGGRDYDYFINRASYNQSRGYGV